MGVITHKGRDDSRLIPETQTRICQTLAVTKVRGRSSIRRLWVQIPPPTTTLFSVQRASSKRRSARKLAGGSNPFRLHHQILPAVIAHKNDPMPAREREGEKGESLDCSL